MMTMLPIADRSTPNARRHLAIRQVRFAGGLFAIFLVLLVLVQQTAPTDLDRRLAREIQAIPWGMFAFVPHGGSEVGGGIIGFSIAPAALAVGLAVLRRWRLLLMLVGIFVLHFVLISPKLFVDAYRPSPRFGVEGGGGLSSFPSGHVQWTVSFWGFVALLAWRYAPRHWGRWVVAPYAVLVGAAMLGRIELGKHWPIDTVAGLIAGLIALHLVMAGELWARSGSPAQSPSGGGD